MVRDVQKKGVEMAQRQEGTRPLSRCASRAGRLGVLTGATAAASPGIRAGAAGTGIIPFGHDALGVDLCICSTRVISVLHGGVGERGSEGGRRSAYLFSAMISLGKRRASRG